MQFVFKTMCGEYLHDEPQQSKCGALVANLPNKKHIARRTPWWGRVSLSQTVNAIDMAHARAGQPDEQEIMARGNSCVEKRSLHNRYRPRPTWGNVGRHRSSPIYLGPKAG